MPAGNVTLEWEDSLADANECGLAMVLKPAAFPAGSIQCLIPPETSAML
jgi:hypothetical protein